MKNVRIYSYGEDALTLWALKNKINDIIDSGEESKMVFYRPSFGRKGGEKSSEFGEFDFIILTDKKIYLGESKWDHSSEIKKSGSEIELKSNQTRRHEILMNYIKSLSTFTDQGNERIDNWENFRKCVLDDKYINNVPEEKSILALNIQTVLDKISSACNKPYMIQNILVIFEKKSSEKKYTVKDNFLNFQIKTIEYGNALDQNFIEVG